MTTNADHPPRPAPTGEAALNLERLRAVLDPLADVDLSAPTRYSDYDRNARPVQERAEPLRPAAVLAPLVRRAGEWRLILTKRAETLVRHAGQIAFPGGRVDPTDPSISAAALREAHEEIGLPPDQVELLGGFDAYETVTGFAVAPFVGVVHGPFVPMPDPAEVDEVFDVVLTTVLDPTNIRVQTAVYQGGRRTYLEICVDGRQIWGATAGMLNALSRRLLS